MKNSEIAIAAIKEEAKKKPNAKIILGSQVITYKELVIKLESGDKIAYESFVTPYGTKLKQDKAFKNTVLRMLSLQ